MGGGVFGVIVVVEFYFNKNVCELMFVESVMFVGFYKVLIKYVFYINLLVVCVWVNEVFINMV